MSKHPSDSTPVNEENANEMAQASDAVESNDMLEGDALDNVVSFAEAHSQNGATGSDIEALSAQNKVLQDQYTRLAADFENFRKRVREEQDALTRYGAQQSVLALLPVLDNLDRAMGSLTEKSDPATLYKSFSVLSKQLLDSLNSLGVSKIPAVGEMFDPQRHEAINRMESLDAPENSILHEAQSGYKLHDKVLRPAMVVVAIPPSDAASHSAEPVQAPELTGNPFVK